MNYSFNGTTPTKGSFFSQPEPRHNSHVYRSHKKDIRHMQTSSDLLHHNEIAAESPEKSDGLRYVSAQKSRYL
jgi:hypothetical protein